MFRQEYEGGAFKNSIFGRRLQKSCVFGDCFHQVIVYGRKNRKIKLLAFGRSLETGITPPWSISFFVYFVFYMFNMLPLVEQLSPLLPTALGIHIFLSTCLVCSTIKSLKTNFNLGEGGGRFPFYALPSRNTLQMELGINIKWCNYCSFRVVLN